MKKIPGEIKTITQTIEVGAEWVADDGKSFKTEAECKTYETNQNKKYRKKEYIKTRDYILNNSKDVILDFEEDEYKIIKYNSKDKFLEDLTSLSFGENTLVSLNSYQYNSKKFDEAVESISFPTVFILSHTDSDWDNGWSENFDFIEGNLYKNQLLKDISIIDNTINLINNKL